MGTARCLSDVACGLTAICGCVRRSWIPARRESVSEANRAFSFLIREGGGHRERRIARTRSLPALCPAAAGPGFFRGIKWLRSLSSSAFTQKGKIFGSLNQLRRIVAASLGASMIVRSVDIEVLLRAESLIRCTRNSPQSRVRLRLAGTSVRVRSPHHDASSALRYSQIRRSKGLLGRRIGSCANRCLFFGRLPPTAPALSKFDPSPFNDRTHQQPQICPF